MTGALSEADVFDSWAIVELMGHRRVVARVSEQTIAGHGFLRLDEPSVGDQPARTQLVSPSSVYALHPVTEDAAMAVAARWRAQPITAWDLPDEWRKAITRSAEVDTWGTPDEDDDGGDDDDDPF